VRKISSGALLALLALAPVARADVWDPGDNSASGTENELIHRSEQVHDLAAISGVADNDYFRIVVQPYSAYEIVVDQTTKDISPVFLERIDSTGAMFNSTTVSSIGYSRVLRWENPTSSVKNEIIHVKAGTAIGNCSTTCTANASYRIRAYDTTYTIERFYDNGGLTTSLVLENPNDYAISGNILYFDGGVADVLLIPAETYTLPARNAVLIPPNPALGTNEAGHVIITSTGGYGDLRGKAMQVNPPPTPESWDHDMLIKR